MAPRTGPDAHGVLLRQLKAAGANVLLTCCACQNARELPLQKVIDRLIARRRGGPETGVRAVASFVDQPCPKCSSAGPFESRPAYPRMPGQG